MAIKDAQRRVRQLDICKDGVGSHTVQGRSHTPIGSWGETIGDTPLPAKETRPRTVDDWSFGVAIVHVLVLLVTIALLIRFI